VQQGQGRVQSACALKGQADFDGLPGGLATLQVDKIDVAIHGRIDDFDEVFFFFLFRQQVHGRTLLGRPADDEGLARPAAARPEAVAVALGQLARAHAPFLPKRRAPGKIAVCRAASELVAPEGNNAVVLRIGLLRVHNFAVYFQLWLDAPILRARAVYSVGCILGARLLAFEGLQMRKLAEGPQNRQDDGIQQHHENSENSTRFQLSTSFLYPIDRTAEAFGSAHGAGGQFAREHMLAHIVPAAFARGKGMGRQKLLALHAEPEWQGGKICQFCTRRQKPVCQPAHARTGCACRPSKSPAQPARSACRLTGGTCSGAQALFPIIA